MGRSKFEMGAEFDTLSQSELDRTMHERLAQQAQDFFREMARGIKYLRPGPFTVTVANSAFSLDGSTKPIGPREGFVWSIRRLVVSGLTAGATPDIANLYRNATSGVPVWQVNGNNFGYTFGKTELLLLAGENLSLVSSGTIAATGQIALALDVIEVAAEQLYKLV